MTTIKNIIFDFGDIFINLDKQAIENNFKTGKVSTPFELISCSVFE